ncbi:hypothetical protein VTL71DRAFT_3497 [Oculimacula yallundae]|uniref:Uncharacterized protein n=1 Tax=Oculimacula yallundae TaxID=86028 RepID=A0ABR4C7B9_9HELO
MSTSRYLCLPHIHDHESSMGYRDGHPIVATSRTSSREKTFGKQRSRRDICAKLTNCAGNAISTAAAWYGIAAQATVDNCNGIAGAVNQYLTNDDYGAVRTIFVGAVIGFAITIVSTPIQYYINAKLEARTGNSNNHNDACGERIPSVFANNAANAIYEFCVSIQHEKHQEATTNFDVLDMTSASANGGGGFGGRAKLFISEQAATWGPTCADHGITWRAKLRRWAETWVGS